MKPKFRPNFTPREKQISLLLADGLPRKIIADRLKISIHTLDVYLKIVRRKCGNFSSTQETAVFLARFYN